MFSRAFAGGLPQADYLVPLGGGRENYFPGWVFTEVEEDLSNKAACYGKGNILLYII